MECIRSIVVGVTASPRRPRGFGEASVVQLVMALVMFGLVLLVLLLVLCVLPGERGGLVVGVLGVTETEV